MTSERKFVTENIRRTILKEYFMKESEASRDYMRHYVFRGDGNVFFVYGKEGYPIAFFSLSRLNKSASLGAIYVKKAFRGLIGAKRRSGTGHRRPTGQRLLEHAFRIARRMGYKEIHRSDIRNFCSSIHHVARFIWSWPKICGSQRATV